MIKIEQKEQAMAELSNCINNCKRCELYKTRNKPLVGDGSVNVELLVIGESPGYYEDIEGKAFVGEAGKILDQLLGLINLTRSEIYITNVLKCHPPRNHNPCRQEINLCINYLHKQIDIIKPKIIITLGKFAAKEIFTKYNLEFTSISELHGTVFEVRTLFNKLENKESFPNSLKSFESQRKIKIIPLFHPAVACYHSEMLDTLKEDFRRLGALIRQSGKVQRLAD